jgi:dienelactone hydrolase
MQIGRDFLPAFFMAHFGVDRHDQAYHSATCCHENLVIQFRPDLITFASIMGAINIQAQETTPAWKLALEKATPTPPLRVPATVSAWESQKKKIRARLWNLLGELPPRSTKPVVKTFSREDRGDYVVEKFEVDNGAGSQVPGYLLLPKGGTAPHPAILYCHWHGGDYHVGKEEIFQKAHTPEVPGPAFVKCGSAVMAIDASGFGERNGKGPGGSKALGSEGESTASKFNLWLGRTLWGMIVRDDLMALDYLCSRPEVDPARIGVTGISMGATRTWWMMALDDRPRTGVPMACMTRYQNLIAHESLSAHGIYYFVPGMLRHFDTEAVIACAAPRPMLFMTGDQDAGSPADGVLAIGDAVKRVYRLYGRESSFQNILYPGLGHACTPEMWKKLEDWMDQQLH